MGSDTTLQERKDLLFGMYQENCTHARHFEALRISVTSIVIAGAVGIISVAASNNGLHCDDWPLTVGLIIIGAYGTVFTSSYFKRITCYDQLAAEFSSELDVLIFEPDEEVKRATVRRLKEIQDAADKKHKDTFAKLSKLPKAVLFRMFWPLTITLIGTAATLYLGYSWSAGKCLTPKPVGVQNTDKRSLDTDEGAVAAGPKESPATKAADEQSSDYKQDADLVRLKQVTAKAESDIKASFDAIEGTTISLPENPKANVWGYNQQDIIHSAEIEKNKFVQAIEGDKLAPLRAYAENFYPIPSHSDFPTLKYEGRDYFDEGSKARALARSVDFVRKMASLLEPGNLTVDVTISSEPPLADYEMSAPGGSPLNTTTNNVLRNVYRGFYAYKLSKPGYKTIEQPLNLVDGGNRLECTLNKTTDSDGPHSCKQQ